MGLSRHLNGGNLIRQFSGVEDVASMDLKDKQCRIQVELHDGSLYTDCSVVKQKIRYFGGC